MVYTICVCVCVSLCGGGIRTLKQNLANGLGVFLIAFYILVSAFPVNVHTTKASFTFWIKKKTNEALLLYTKALLALHKRKNK